MTDPALLEVENLRVAYGDLVAVRDLSFALAPARCLGVIGESGAGKTQAFLALMKLLPDRAHVGGVARLRGQSLLDTAATSYRGRDAAMIFQDPLSSLTPHLTIGDQVAEPLVTHRGQGWKEARLQAARLLDQVRMNDIPRRLRQYPHELSGGMRQRAMIAMALACDPPLLIADEPTTALDVSVQAQLLALLRELMRERRMALALITHDMGVIAALADDVLVMRQGSVVERGPVARLLGQPAHEYTRALLAAMPRMDGAVPVAPAITADTPLAVRGLTVRYRVRRHSSWRTQQLVAVEDASFELHAGEALGVVGESGSGKSTLTRALLRLGPAAAGEVVWLGHTLREIEGRALRELRATLQIVFQDPFASLDPTMSAAECIAEPLRALRPGMDRQGRAAAVRRALEDVGLEASFAARRSPTLSGGQCQRVAIARAMVLAPKLLVCDEAVSALDVSVQAQILELLARIKREQGTSLLFVSHNLAVVRQLCERVLVMYLGRIVEAGPTAQVFAAPRHPYTRMLLESVPLLDPQAERARLQRLVATGETPSQVERPSGCAFRTRCPAAAPDCARWRPELECVEESHQVACLRWRELRN
ncbi:MAG TPA: ABC transporter ATP-binding protein [Steroidobacteraceae bacterium]|nr:ABC transporter ATP-binding protein [Steroidobacteraceae bacterium]